MLTTTVSSRPDRQDFFSNYSQNVYVIPPPPPQHQKKKATKKKKTAYEAQDLTIWIWHFFFLLLISSCLFFGWATGDEFFNPFCD